ncbi:L-aspartate oxidase [Verrucomicrobiota bacterium]
MKTLDTDYFVVGSGIAGLMSALGLARHGRVLVVTKKDRAESNTNHAQGGIACVVASDDNLESHMTDTLGAGAGLCDEKVVREIVTAAPERIAELTQLGVEFARDELGSGYDLGKEGGHSHRRVLHAGDVTGREIEGALLRKAHREPNISIMEHCMVIDLITTGWLAGERSTPPHPNPLPRGEGGEERRKEDNRCVGAYVLERNTGEIMAVRAPYVVMASGGGGKVYLYTSNPDIATGDGVAVAWRAGVPIKNMEFIQFHPTCLYHPDAKSFLISEAVRGEGAELVDAEGNKFMEKYDNRGALAPRDIVARAIDNEMKAGGVPCVYLDIRHRSESFLKRRFPTICERCSEFGFDMAHDLVPVVPAAHYFCGGIDAAIDGETALPGLFACGEAACTGLHGANRLASNSLLEAVVCAHEMVAKIAGLPPADSYTRPGIPDWEPGAAVPSDETIVVEHNWNEVRTCMWDYVGIVRTDKRLERAARRIANLRGEIRQYYLDYLVTADILELRNIAAVGELIIRSAQLRKESRGLHYTLDYPESDESKNIDTVIADEAGRYVG